jgi:hypothetical protein
MTGSTEVTVRLVPDRGDDPEVLATLAARLRSELLELEVASVEPAADPELPEHAKGAGTLAGLLTVRLAWNRLRALVVAAQEWATRNRRVVEVSYGGDTLKVTGVTAAQQEKIIDDWIARHAASS